MGMDAEFRAQLTQRLEVLKAVAAARKRIVEVLAILADSESEEQEIADLQQLLGIERGAAERVLMMQLRMFRTKPLDIIAMEIADLEDQLEARTA